MRGPDAISQSHFRNLLTRSVVMPPVLFAVLSCVFLAQIMYLLSAAQWVSHTDEVIDETHAILTLLVDGETGLRGYLIAGRPEFLEPYQQADEEIDAAFASVLRLVADNPPQVQRLQEIVKDHASWRKFARSLIEIRRQEGDYLTHVRAGEGKKLMDAMRARIAEVIRVEENLREDRKQRAERATWIVVGTSLCLALVLGGVLAYFTRGQLLRVSASHRTALADVEHKAESLRKSAHRLETLHEIDKAILAAESVPEVARSALGRMEQVVPSAEAFIILFPVNGGPVEVLSRANQRTSSGNSLSQSLQVITVEEFAKTQELRSFDDLADLENPHLFLRALLEAGQRSAMKVPVAANGQRCGLMIFADPRRGVFTTEHQEIAAEIGRQLAIAFQQASLRTQLERHAAELEQRVEERTRELRESLESVKQLQGLLPICAWCKKVRDDQDYWHEVEHYVSAHTDAKFSHGICPNCFKANIESFRSGPSTA